MPRGSRTDKRGRLNWSNKKANCGRRGGLGNRNRFTTYKQVQSAIRRNRTLIVTPPKEEGEAPQAPAVETAAPAAAVAETAAPAAE